MNIKSIFAAVFLAMAIMVSVVPVVYAQTPGLPNNPANPGPDGGIGSGNPIEDDFQLVPCNGTDCDFEDLLLMGNRIIKFALFIMTPIMIGMLVYTGFKYMAAGGDANLIADAKRMLKPIIIGLILIFGAWIIVYGVLDKILADKIGDIKKDQIVPGSVSGSN